MVQLVQLVHVVHMVQLAHMVQLVHVVYVAGTTGTYGSDDTYGIAGIAGTAGTYGTAGTFGTAGIRFLNIYLYLKDYYVAISSLLMLSQLSLDILVLCLLGNNIIYENCHAFQMFCLQTSRRQLFLELWT